jgi:hypothetical protein
MPSNPSEPSPAPIDPYLRWALESGADGLFGGVARGAERALPLLVERGSRPWAALRGTSGVLHAPEANDPTPFGAVWLAAEALAGFVQWVGAASCRSLCPVGRHRGLPQRAMPPMRAGATQGWWWV